jgi:hypothetical protein
MTRSRYFRALCNSTARVEHRPMRPSRGARETLGRVGFVLRQRRVCCANTSAPSAQRARATPADQLFATLGRSDSAGGIQRPVLYGDAPACQPGTCDIMAASARTDAARTAQYRRSSSACRMGTSVARAFIFSRRSSLQSRKAWPEGQRLERARRGRTSGRARQRTGASGCPARPARAASQRGWHVSSARRAQRAHEGGVTLALCGEAVARPARRTRVARAL